MESLTKISDSIYRLVIPYKDIFTTVYAVKTDDGVIVFDVATNEYDVETYILPMLREIGVRECDVKGVFISHAHRDHVGGLASFMEKFPKAKIISRSEKLRDETPQYSFIMPSDNGELFGVFRAIAIPGHTSDSMALLDTRTNTLITGDSLQVYGIFGSDDWGANITLTKEHVAAIEKLRGFSVENIYTAHDFHPYGFRACGKEAVSLFLDDAPSHSLKSRG